MELPVVVSDVGGAPEGMVDGETGLLVPERDVEAIALCIRRLYESPDLRMRMGHAGKIFVEGRFGIQETTKRMLEEYSKEKHNVC
jgi:glycosyltransferase involved in cell wall biosynthesis